MIEVDSYTNRSEGDVAEIWGGGADFGLGEVLAGAAFLKLGCYLNAFGGPPLQW